MHIHTGDDEHMFDLAEVDSISFAELAVNISVEPEAINFGAVVIGDSRGLILTLINTGEGILIIDSIVIEEQAFEVEFENPLRINPGQSHDMTVSFYPYEEREFSTDMIIHSNSQENPEVSIPLSGLGVCAFDWEETGNRMTVRVNRATINNESLVEGDEIGVFTNDELCAGGVTIPAGFAERSIDFPIFGADDGEENGFQGGELLEFRIWDRDTQHELFAKVELIVEMEPRYLSNELLLVVLHVELD